jgi:hypothetical protein
VGGQVGKDPKVRDQVTSTETTEEGGASTEGGGASTEAEARYLSASTAGRRATSGTKQKHTLPANKVVAPASNCHLLALSQSIWGGPQLGG